MISSSSNDINEIEAANGSLEVAAEVTESRATNPSASRPCIYLKLLTKYNKKIFKEPKKKQIFYNGQVFGGKIWYVDLRS